MVALLQPRFAEMVQPVAVTVTVRAIYERIPRRMSRQISTALREIWARARSPIPASSERKTPRSGRSVKRSR